MPMYSTDKGFTGSGAAYSSKTTTTRSSAPNAAAAAASARLNSGNAGKSTPSGVGNQMGGGGVRTDTTNKAGSSTRAGAVGSTALSRIGGNNNAVARTIASSPMGAALGAFGNNRSGISSSPFGFGNAQAMAAKIAALAPQSMAPQRQLTPVGGITRTPEYAAAMGFISPFAGNGIAGDPSANRQPVVGQVNRDEIRVPQRALPGFSEAQFGNQRYAPGQMYANPATQAPALRSVVNNINLLGQDPRQKVDMMLKNMGYENDAGRAGITGTWGHESMGYSPKVLNGTIQGDEGTAFGLGQWRFDRQAAAKGYMNDMGLPMNDIAGQAAFGGTELANSYPKAYSGVMNAATPAQGVAAMHHYELPKGYKTFAKTGDPTVVAGWDDRLKRANAAYNATGDFGPVVAPSTMVASNGQTVPQGAQITPAASTGIGWADTIKGLMPKSVQDKIDAGTAAYNQYADQYAKMPGSDAQKAAAIKGYAQNGILGGAWGYLTGGGIGPGTSANVDNPAKPGYQGSGDGRKPQEQTTVSEQQLSQLSAGQRSEYERLIGAGLSPAEALKAAKAYSVPTTTPTVPGWVPPSFITRPYTVIA